MKTNEAPNKLYLINDVNVVMLSYDPLTKLQGNRYDFIDKEVFPIEEGCEVEYTRTDYAEKDFLIKAKRFLSEIHRVCDITDENGYRIELRDLQARFENFYKETKI